VYLLLGIKTKIFKTVAFEMINVDTRQLSNNTLILVPTQGWRWYTTFDTLIWNNLHLKNGKTLINNQS